MSVFRTFARFSVDSVRLVLRGNSVYWGWIAMLLVLIGSGVLAYWRQLETGLVVTAMRDQVSWGFYIGNFTFLVGVAAAAVILVIPAYVYHWKPIREIVVIVPSGAAGLRARTDPTARARLRDSLASP